MANKILLNFSSGMNTRTSPLIIKDSESELVLNYNLDKLGALTRRNGYSRYLTQPVADKSIIGLYQFNNTSGNSNLAVQLMVLDSASTTRKTYYNNAGTWTEAQSLTVSSS